jgi:recombination DNA repair RAD52 pathway protein
MLEPVFTPEQIVMLNTPLGPNEIEQKQGMSYLKGQLAVVKANNIFGYGNWGYQLASGVEVINTETENKNHNVIYRVRVAVTLEVRGCMPITEIGDCEAQGTGPAAMSMAEKGAVTDGLKRCLKNFGPTFGLDLYFKTPPAQAASQPTQQPRQINPQPQPNFRPAPTTPKEAVKEIQHIHATVPVTQPTPIKAEEKISQKGIDSIVSLAGTKGLDEMDLAKKSVGLYKKPLANLTLTEGQDFYRILLKA